MSAHAINQHPHLDAPFDRGGQGIHQRLASSIIAENIGHQVDALTGAVNGVQHGLIGLRCIQ